MLLEGSESLIIEVIFGTCSLIHWEVGKKCESVSGHTNGLDVGWSSIVLCTEEEELESINHGLVSGIQHAACKSNVLVMYANFFSECCGGKQLILLLAFVLYDKGSEMKFY